MPDRRRVCLKGFGRLNVRRYGGLKVSPSHFSPDSALILAHSNYFIHPSHYCPDFNYLLVFSV